jgi:hypothetical protein
MPSDSEAFRVGVIPVAAKKDLNHQDAKMPRTSYFRLGPLQAGHPRIFRSRKKRE